MKLKSPQARAIRRSLILRLLAGLAAYMAVFAAAAFLVEQYVVPQVAEYVLDVTAPWKYYTEEEYDRLVDTGRIDENKQVIAQYRDSEGNWVSEHTAATLYYNTLEESGGEDTAVVDRSDVQLVGYAVRNLKFYNFVSDMRLPFVLVLWVLGALAVVLAVLNRSIRYFDELSSAVAGLFADRTAGITLSDNLSIARAELIDIQNRALSDARAAEMAEQRKNELVAYLAHDIRTPLTSVLGYLSLLKDSPDLPLEARARYAGIAYEKAERLEALIDEFFEITRYNLQSIPIERQQVDVELFCRQLADEFFPECEAQNVTMRIAAPENATFFIDPDKMARALSNVLRNAVAFAEAGSEVRLAAKVQPGQVTLTVTNRGREISAVHLQSIFEKFFREDGARSTNQGGAGLGLAIAKEIVQAHSGIIAATSENGVTTFTIVVPR